LYYLFCLQTNNVTTTALYHFASQPSASTPPTDVLITGDTNGLCTCVSLHTSMYAGTLRRWHFASPRDSCILSGNNNNNAINAQATMINTESANNQQQSLLKRQIYKLSMIDNVHVLTEQNNTQNSNMQNEQQQNVKGQQLQVRVFCLYFCIYFIGINVASGCYYRFNNGTYG
jgi:hypothetical protein